jgi:ribokinase
VGVAKPTIAIIGHVEHVTLGLASSLPAPGDVLHLEECCVIPGGGGGVTFFQLVKSPARLHLFTAIGADAGGREVEERLRRTEATLHLARRNEAHTRDIVLLTPDGERTILVLGQPLHPRRDDPLPWEILPTCDAAYFTAYDPGLLRDARRAKLLVVSARRRESLAHSGVRADVVVGSCLDKREQCTLADFAVKPGALVLTQGSHGGYIETAEGTQRFAAPPAPKQLRSSYGAGDSFAGALIWYLTQGLAMREACTRAGHHGAAVLAGIDTVAAQLALSE